MSIMVYETQITVGRWQVSIWRKRVVWWRGWWSFAVKYTTLEEA